LHQTAKTLLPANKFGVVGYGCNSAIVVIGENKVFRTIETACPTSSVKTPITACLTALKTLWGKFSHALCGRDLSTNTIML
ncbi:MAG: hypothetical protein CMM24_02775, partial [Rhodospirillaceae bacterium]|nr:hypothetical protein [Rhodospirillaceae bacterium]